MSEKGVFKQRTLDTTNEHLDHASDKFTVMLLGDSMFERFKTTGEDFKFPDHLFNAGIGGDKIENVIYRLISLNLLDSFPNVKKIILMIGTNNMNVKNPKYEGIIDALIKILKNKNIEIIMYGIPYIIDSPKEKIDKYNKYLDKFVNDKSVNTFTNISNLFTDEDYDDKVHFNKKGYKKFYDQIIRDL